MFGIPVTCKSCNGRTRLKEKYGECDYCGSLLVAPIPLEEISIEPKRTHQKIFVDNSNVSTQCAKLVEILKDVRKPMAISELVGYMDETMTQQKCSALLRKLMNDGVVERVEMRRKAYFQIKGA